MLRWALLLVCVSGCVSEVSRRPAPFNTQVRAPVSKPPVSAELLTIPQAQASNAASPQLTPQRRAAGMDRVADGDATLLNRRHPESDGEGQSAPAEPDLYCVVGPQVLREIDAVEQEGQSVVFALNGHSATPEQMAEHLIAACVEQIQEGVRGTNANLPASSEEWMLGLAYMQSWLRSRSAPADAE